MAQADLPVAPKSIDLNLTCLDLKSATIEELHLRPISSAVENIRILTGYVCGIVLEGGLLGAWMGMFADNIWRGTAGFTRYCRGKWVHTKV